MSESEPGSSTCVDAGVSPAAGSGSGTAGGAEECTNPSTVIGSASTNTLS